MKTFIIDPEPISPATKTALALVNRQGNEVAIDPFNERAFSHEVLVLTGAGGSLRDTTQSD